MNTLARVNTIPTLLDTFFGPSFMTRPYVTRYSQPALTTPAVNIKDTETAYQVEVAAPGAKKDDFSLSLNQNVLTISFKHEQADEETKDSFIRKEFAFQSFERSFRLPKTVNAEAIAATYADGILTVELPKQELPKPEVKQIEIA
jgi:HSP20 family protein